MWEETLDYSLRHCWQHKDGHFYLDDGDPFNPVRCTNPQDHPYSRGKVEFMRWIHAFNKLAPNIVAGDLPDGWIKVDMSSEIYGDIVFVDFHDKKARVAVTERYADQARRAKELVDISYAEESEALGV